MEQLEILLEEQFFREPIICKNVPRLVSHWTDNSWKARFW